MSRLFCIILLILFLISTPRFSAASSYFEITSVSTDSFPRIMVEVQLVAEPSLADTDLRSELRLQLADQTLEPAALQTLPLNPNVYLCVHPGGMGKKSFKQIAKVMQDFDKLTGIDSIEGILFSAPPRVLPMDSLSSATPEPVDSLWIDRMKKLIEKIASDSSTQHLFMLAVDWDYHQTKSLKRLYSFFETCPHCWWGMMIQYDKEIKNQTKYKQQLFLTAFGRGHAIQHLQAAYKRLVTSRHRIFFQSKALQPQKEPRPAIIRHISSGLQDTINLDLDNKAVSSHYAEFLRQQMQALIDSGRIDSARQVLLNQAMPIYGYAAFDSSAIKITEALAAQTVHLDSVKRFITIAERDLPDMIAKHPEWWYNNVVRSRIDMLYQQFLHLPVPVKPAVALAKLDTLLAVIPNKTGWRKKYKVDAWEKAVNDYNNAPEPIKLDFYDRILALHPHDRDIRFKKFTLLGSRARRQKKYLAALKNYNKALDAIYNKAAKNTQREIADQAFDFFHRENNYGQMYLLQNLYMELSPGFKNHFLIADLAKKNRKYKEALEHYNWLMENWTDDQDHLTWDELIANMKSCYLGNGDLQTAAIFLKRSLQSKTIDMKEIDTYIMFYLAEPVKLFFQCLKTLNDQSGSSGKVKQVLDRVAKQPHGKGIQTLRLLQNKIPQSGWGTVSVTPSAGVVWRFESKSLIHHITLPDGTLYAEITLPEDERLRAMAPQIEQNVLNQRSWQALRDEIENESAVLLGRWCAELVAAHKASADGQWDIIFEPVYSNDRYLYMALQNNEEKIIWSKSFDPSKTEFSGNDWERSSVTPLLFKSDITLNGSKARDIAIPVYDENNWLGVLRLGVE